MSNFEVNRFHTSNLNYLGLEKVTVDSYHIRNAL